MGDKPSRRHDVDGVARVALAHQDLASRQVDRLELGGGRRQQCGREE